MALIYHITSPADWEQAVRAGTYELSTRDTTLAQEGYIHASTEAQLASVANAHYPGVPGLVVLEIDTSRVEPEIRFEQLGSAPEPFPHIYGPLSPSAVTRVLPLEPDASGQFHFAANSPAANSPQAT